METPDKKGTKTKKATDAVKKTASKAGSYVKANPLTMVYVGVGIVAIYGIYKIIKAIDNTTGGIGEDEDAGGGNDDLTNPSGIEPGATINNIQVQVLAADILSAVDGFYGLNESEYMVIENALRSKTPEDFQLISQAFGTPSRSPITGEETFWWMGEKLNLSQWLTIEMDAEQKTRIREAAPLIFAN